MIAGTQRLVAGSSRNEEQINEQHPQPRWARNLNAVDEKGLRFMRGNADEE